MAKNHVQFNGGRGLNLADGITVAKEAEAEKMKRDQMAKLDAALAGG